MKKIILSITISILGFSTLSYADLNFRFSIPQPNFVSNDWDNDGQPNEIDPDDDNDGLNDTEDSIPFGRGGQSSTPDVTVNSFDANKNSYFSGETLTLSWNVDNIRSLNLYDDALLTNHLGDVTNQNSISVSPTGDMTYYLDTETGVSQVSIFEYQETNRSCNAWTPEASTITSGTTFTQTRNCTIDYSSNEPSTTSVSTTESQQALGTLVNMDCRNDYNNFTLVYYTNASTGATDTRAVKANAINGSVFASVTGHVDSLNLYDVIYYVGTRRFVIGSNGATYDVRRICLPN